MRIRLPIKRAAFLAAAFLFALVALLPLRLALDWMGFPERGLSARAANGSLWFGALQEAQVGPVALGDVTARLNLLPLFLGRARLSIASEDPDVGIVGAVIVSRNSFAFDGINGSFRGGTLFPSLPVGMISLDDFDADFVNGQCVRAGGRVRLMIAGDLAGLGMASGLSGIPRCEGDALLLPLASRTGLEQLNARIYGDGRYRLELLVRPSEAAVGAGLVAAGLRPIGRGYGLRVDGAF